MTIRTPHNAKTGFTLIELAVGITIIGLLIGGVLIGRSMVRSGQIRAVITEHSRYLTSERAFEDKYNGLPGDMYNATAYWGKDNTNCSGHTGSVGTPGTCNGDGDGLMEYSGSLGGTAEVYQFWKQLVLAGYITGDYTGLAGTNNVQECSSAQKNCPTSKMPTAMWALRSLSATYAGDSNMYALDYGNYFIFGGELTASFPFTNVLTPEEAYQIDKKIDDGRPAFGSVIARRWNNVCAVADSGASANTNFNASYKVSDKSLQCTLFFIKQF